MHYKIAKKFEARKDLIHLVKEYPRALIVDFDLRKVVLRAETRFAIIEHYRKKNQKFDFFCDSCWAKSVFSYSQAYVLR